MAFGSGAVLGSARVLLGVDDTGLKRGLRSAETSFDRTTRSMQARSSSLVGSLAATSKALIGLGGTLGAAFAIPAVINQFKTFEQSMSRVEGLVGASREQMQSWNDEVLALAKTLPMGPQELANALYFVTSSGVDAGQAMNVVKMSAQAAAAGLGDTAVVADAVTSAMNAWATSGLSATEATDVLIATVREGKGEPDELAQSLGRVLAVAANAGVEFNEVGAAIAGMTRVGLDSAEATTALRGLFVGITAPGSKAAKAMAEVGLSAKELRRQIREEGLWAALQTISKALEGNVEAARKLFPNIRAMNGFFILTGQQADKTATIFQKMADVTGSTAKAFEVASQTASFQWDTAMTTIQVAAVRVGGAIAPALASAATQVVGLIEDFQESRGTMGQVRKAAEDFAGAIRWLSEKLRSLSDDLGGARTGLLLLFGLMARGTVTGLITSFIRLGVVIGAIGPASRTAAIAYGSSMAAMQAATVGLGATIRAVLIGTGIGAIAVAVGIAAALVITHWDTVTAAFRKSADVIRDKFAALWFYLRERAVKTALEVVEPFSHLPGKMGRWAQEAKESLQRELEDINLDRVERQLEERGYAAGTAYGRGFTRGVTPAIRAALAGEVTGGPGSTADRPAGALPGTAGTTALMPSTTVPTTRTRGYHPTGGLAGFPAIDWFAEPGTPVLAPEDGRIVRHSGRGGTSGQVYGWSIYFAGDDTGNLYFITHLARKRAPVGRYKKGAVLGYVSAWEGGAAHAHVGVRGPGAKTRGTDTPSDGGDGADTKPPAEPPIVPLRLQERLGRAEADIRSTEDDLRALRAIEAYLTKRIATEKDINRRIKMLAELKQVREAIARIMKGEGEGDREGDLIPKKIQLRLAEAELTKTTEDDLRVLRQIEAYLEKRLKAEMSINERIRLLGELKAVRGQIAALGAPVTGAIGVSKEVQALIGRGVPAPGRVLAGGEFAVEGAFGAIEFVKPIAVEKQERIGRISAKLATEIAPMRAYVQDLINHQKAIRVKLKAAIAARDKLRRIRKPAAAARAAQARIRSLNNKIKGYQADIAALEEAIQNAIAAIAELEAAAKAEILAIANEEEEVPAAAGAEGGGGAAAAAERPSPTALPLEFQLRQAIAASIPGVREELALAREQEALFEARLATAVAAGDLQAQIELINALTQLRAQIRQMMMEMTPQFQLAQAQAQMTSDIADDLALAIQQQAIFTELLAQAIATGDIELQTMVTQQLTGLQQTISGLRGSTWLPPELRLAIARAEGTKTTADDLQLALEQQTILQGRLAEAQLAQDIEAEIALTQALNSIANQVEQLRGQLEDGTLNVRDETVASFLGSVLRLREYRDNIFDPFAAVRASQITLNNYYQATPEDPAQWSAAVLFDLQALLGA